MNDYKTEADLIAAGFEFTPNIWHTGKGSGKVYEKITEGVRTFYGVDTEGAVSKLEFTGGQPSVAVEPVAPVEPVAEPAVEPEAEVPTETTQEA
jgi:hypothetical protein